MGRNNTRTHPCYSVRSKSGLFFRLPRLILVLVVSIGAGVRTLSAPKPQTDTNAAVQEAYRAGGAAAARNDFKTAETEFAKVVLLAPQIEEGHSALGVVLLRLGKVTQAIQELEKAIALKPGDLTAQTNLALAYEQSGDYAKAISLFKRLEDETASDPSHSLPSYVLAAYARSLAAAGQLPAAIAKMKASVAAAPQYAELHDALGSLYAQMNDWPSADHEFREAISIKPNYAPAHLHLGAALLKQQQSSVAIAELELASQLAPGNAVAAGELGKAYAANSQDDRAITALRRAIKLDPTYTEAKYQLALALQRTGHNADAIPLLRQVVRAETRNADAGTNLGLALLLAGNAKDALSYLEQSVKRKTRRYHGAHQPCRSLPSIRPGG